MSRSEIPYSIAPMIDSGNPLINTNNTYYAHLITLDREVIFSRLPVVRESNLLSLQSRTIN